MATKRKANSRKKKAPTSKSTSSNTERKKSSAEPKSNTIMEVEVNLKREEKVIEKKDEIPRRRAPPRGAGGRVASHGEKVDELVRKTAQVAIGGETADGKKEDETMTVAIRNHLPVPVPVTGMEIVPFVGTMVTTQQRNLEVAMSRKHPYDLDFSHDDGGRPRKIARIIYSNPNDRGNQTYRIPYGDVKELSLVDVDLNDLGPQIQGVKVEKVVSHGELAKDYALLPENRIKTLFSKYENRENPMALEVFKERRVIEEKVKNMFPLDNESYNNLMNDPWIKESKKNKDELMRLGQGRPSLQNSVVARIMYGIEFVVEIRDLPSLKPGTYLNDSIVDFGVVSALKDLGLNPPEVCVLSSMYFCKMMKPLDEPFPESSTQSMYTPLIRQSGDLLKIKYLAIPVVREQHWFLAIICNPFPDPADVKKMERKVKDAEKKFKPYLNHVRELYNKWLNKEKAPPSIMIMDSLSEKIRRKISNYDDFLDNTMSYVKRALIEIHDKHWEKTGRSYFRNHDNNIAENIKAFSLVCSQQPNEYDCGMFVIDFVKAFFNGLKLCNGDYMRAALLRLLAKREDTNLKRILMEMNILDYCKEFNPSRVDEVRDILRNQKKTPRKFN